MPVASHFERSFCFFRLTSGCNWTGSKVFSPSWSTIPYNWVWYLKSLFCAHHFHGLLCPWLWNILRSDLPPFWLRSNAFLYLRSGVFPSKEGFFSSSTGGCPRCQHAMKCHKSNEMLFLWISFIALLCFLLSLLCCLS